MPNENLPKPVNIGWGMACESEMKTLPVNPQDTFPVPAVTCRICRYSSHEVGTTVVSGSDSYDALVLLVIRF